MKHLLPGFFFSKNTKVCDLKAGKNTSAPCVRIILILFLVFVSSIANASHFKGGNITYNYLGEGRYEILINSYWHKDEVGNIYPRYEGFPQIHGFFPVTLSKTLLPDGETIEHVQKQEVTWAEFGVYKIYYTTCCRAVGSNFDNNDIGMFASVSYAPGVISSSPQFADTFILNFNDGQPLKYSIGMQDVDGHEQEYLLEIPYGLTADAYNQMLATGFQLQEDGTMVWENPQAGQWLVSIKIREKINGVHTGAYVNRSYLLNVVSCDAYSTGYTIKTQPCVGGSNGVVTLNAPQGVSPFLYSLDSGMSFQTVPDFENLSAGSFTAVVKDAIGCLSEPVQITLEEIPLAAVTINIPADVCINGGAVQLTGENPAGGSYSGTAVNNGAFYPDQAGIGTHTIYYTYTDNNGCSNTASQEVVVHETPLAYAGEDAVVYATNGNGAGRSCTTLTASASLGSSPYTFRWSTGALTQSIDVCPEDTITYTVTVADAFGCKDADDVTVSVAEQNGNGNGTGGDKNPDKPGNGWGKGGKNGDKNTSNQTGFFVFPNPVTPGSKVQVKLKEADRIRIDIVDNTSGKVVKTLYAGPARADEELSFRVGKIPEGRGFAICRLITTKQVYTLKLMKK